MNGGLTVVELPGPAAARAGRLLALLGERVVRVEHGSGPNGGPHDQLWRAGKELAVVDATAAIEDVVGPLLATADVILDGEPCGDRPERLARANPAAVVVALSPWGRVGDRSGWLATDHVVAAAGGWTAHIGHPGGAPIAPPGEQVWALAGVVGAAAALLGSLARSGSPTGTVVDVSALEVVAATLESAGVAWIHEGRTTPRPGRNHPLVVHQLLRAADGWLATGLGGNEGMWQRLRAWLADEGDQGLLDPDFDEPEDRLRHRGRIAAVLGRFVAGRSRTALWHEAQGRRLPWAAVLAPREVVESPQLAHRGFFRQLGEGARAPGLAWRCHPPPATAVRPAPEAAAPPAGGGQARLPPLRGVRVLDLTWVLAGPFATRILADHGADVIKVESAHRPDPTRFSPTMYVGRTPSDPETGGYFANHNRNKRSIRLNLKHPDGQKLLQQLIDACDVVIENFSAGTLRRWDLDPAALVARKPDLVVVSLSAMGQTGPWSGFVSYADTVSALSGLTALTVDGHGEPVGVVFGLADLVAGYHGALATIAALHARHRTGQGAAIDLSQLEAMCANLSTELLHDGEGGLIHPPEPAARDVIVATAGTDRWCAASLPLDERRRGELMVAVAQLAPHAGHDLAGEGLEPVLASVAAGMAAEVLAERLQSLGVPAAPVSSAADLVERDPQLAAGGFYLRAQHPVIGSHLVEGDPIRIDGRRPPIRRGAPLLGQDTAAVFDELLGLSPERIDDLVSEGVLE